MKKFALAGVLALLVTVSPFAARTAFAEEVRYSRIVSEDVVLYMDPGLGVKWFTLPYGYYVKILSISATSIKVEYKDGTSRPSAKGYIPISDLNVSEETPSAPYPSLTLTVNQTCMLYKDVDFSLTETITPNSTLDFYGIFTRSGGSKYIYGYVSATSGDKYVGYIPYDAVYEFTPPRLEIASETAVPPEKTEEIEPAANEPSPAPEGLTNALQIAIIVAVSLVAVSIVYFLFRPSATKAKDEALSDDDG